MKIELDRSGTIEGLRRTIEWIGENLDRYRPDQYTV